ncbi:Tripeptidyl-peptidase 2 [Nymphaea thermarum]|nr:Tripeptidyl-peptidase 2 [Nymphaea thermarum]
MGEEEEKGSPESHDSCRQRRVEIAGSDTMHENIHYLEKMKELVLFIERNLEAKDFIHLSCFSQPDGPITGNSSFTSLVLVPGEREAFYVGPPPKDKLPKCCSAGSILLGEISYGSLSLGAKEDGKNTQTCPVFYPLSYMVPPLKLDEKDKDKDGFDSKKSLSERVDEEVCTCTLRAAYSRETTPVVVHNSMDPFTRCSGRALIHGCVNSKERCSAFPRTPKLGRREPNAPSTTHNSTLGPCTACAPNRRDQKKSEQNGQLWPALTRTSTMEEKLQGGRETLRRGRFQQHWKRQVLESIGCESVKRAENSRVGYCKPRDAGTLQRQKWGDRGSFTETKSRDSPSKLNSDLRTSWL